MYFLRVNFQQQMSSALQSLETVVTSQW